MKAGNFILSTVLLVLLSANGRASDNMKANIQIFEAVQLGSTQLAPGAYRITWTESGPNVQVTFSQGGKVIATVPAQASPERSGYHFPALHIDGASNKLIGVELPKVSLSFTSENPDGAKLGN